MESPRTTVQAVPAALFVLSLAAGISSCLAVQVAQTQVQRSSTADALSRAVPQTCAALTNMGTYSTVRLGLGTPPQMFDVVADTGSDSVVVTSCLCEQGGGCSQESKCFQGTGQSSTFQLVTMSSDAAASEDAAETDSSDADVGNALVSVDALMSTLTSKGDKQLEVVSLTYGSGPITAVVATDYAQVGSVRTLMPGGVLLMVQEQLNIDGAFDGILGLGLPQVAPKDVAAAGATPTPPGFLEQAGVPRFSMCFNDNADGVLRLAVPESPLALGTVGTAHWGLDFRGISVGQDDVGQVLFCTEADMVAGQKTPCGAIPDSGTTVMMGPADQVQSLFGSLCSQWPRCQSLVSDKHSQSTSDLFQSLLYNCSSWMGEKGLDELPNIFFHVQGSEGKAQSLRMTGYDYVMLSEEPQVKEVTKYLKGAVPYTVNKPTGKDIEVCSPAFGTMEYNTEVNGPVWILGTPVFYDFQVVYDLKASPPTVAFDSTPCGSCAEGTESKDRPALLSANSATSGRRQPRRVRGPLKVNHFDTSKPL